MPSPARNKTMNRLQKLIEQAERDQDLINHRQKEIDWDLVREKQKAMMKRMGTSSSKPRKRRPESGM